MAPPNVHNDNEDKAEMSLVLTPDVSSTLHKKTDNDDTPDLVELSQVFRESIPCKNRLYRLRLFRNCFVGKEAVDLLVVQTHKSRDEARAIGTLLGTAYCPFEHVCDPQAHRELEDGYVFYRFTETDHHHANKMDSSSKKTQTSTTSKHMSDSSSHQLSGSLEHATQEEKIRVFEQGIQVQDRKFRLRTYRNCFVAREAVDFMMKTGMAATREAAVVLGREWMQKYNLFEHVLRQHDFEDEYLFFRFVTKANRLASSFNSQPFANYNADIHLHLLLGDSETSSDGDSAHTTKATDDSPFHVSFALQPPSVLSGSAAQNGNDEHVGMQIGSPPSLMTGSTSTWDTPHLLHSLTEVVEAMELNIPVKRRRWRFRHYDDCFVARQAVDYLVKAGFAPDRASAVRLGKHIQRELNAYHHVCEEHDFADEHYFFRFLPREQRFGEPVLIELPLDQIAVQFERGVRVGSHTYRMRTYADTFVGEKAVDYLVQSRLADSRTTAVRLGKALVENYGLFVNVTGDVEFADGDFLFQFVPRERRKDQSTMDVTVSSLDGSIPRLQFTDDMDGDLADNIPEMAKPTFIFSAEGLREHRLHETADTLRSGIETKRNRWGARIYPGTFIGSQAVTFLVNSSCAQSRMKRLSWVAACKPN